MEFRIKRISSWYADEKPCEGAFLHHVEKDPGYKDKKFWHIRIESLEELQKLSEKLKELLIIGGQDEDGFPAIEIYDDYRE